MDGFFDGDYYLAQASAPGPSKDDALAHYLEVGWLHGHDPSPRFSTSAYLLAYPDVKAAGTNPLIHYLLHGRFEGRLALPSSNALQQYFDPAYYRAQLPDPPAHDQDGLEHYLTRGWLDGYDPCTAFSTRAYLYANPDVAAAGVNPLLHFVLHGREEGRSTYPVDAIKACDSSTLLISIVFRAGSSEQSLEDRLRALPRRGAKACARRWSPRTPGCEENMSIAAWPKRRA
jgi:hypothetical protein